MKIWYYFARTFLGNCLISILGLMALFTFLSLLETLDDVGKGDFTAFHAIQIVILTSATRFIELLPVTLILGSLLTIGGMSNNRELLVMRAIGISKWQLVYTLSFVGAAVAILCFVLFETLIPTLEKKAHELSTLTLEKTTIGKSEVWTRENLSTLRIGNLSSRYIPRQIEIYETSPSGDLKRLITAEKAFLQNATNWLLFDVRETNFLDDEVTEKKLDNLIWKSFLSKEQFGRLVAPPITLSTTELVRHLKQNKTIAIDDSEYLSVLWEKISLPITLIAMAILGVPLLGSSTNFRSGGYHTVVGGAIGIIFYLAEQTASNLDQLLNLPPYLTALVPATTVIIFSLLAIRRAP